MGGVGSEREISLQSGGNVAAALRGAGFDVVEFDIAPDRLGILDDASVDVFYPVLHGEFGEDGQLQEILEGMGLVYVGSDSRSSRLAFDKIASKEAFRAGGVRVARDVCITSGGDLEGLCDKLAKVGERFVVKPIREGSSVGVEIVSGHAEAAAAGAKCFEKYGECMIEEFIAGREITVGILNGRALPVIEIRSKMQFYDYHAKYVDDATEYLFDTIVDSEVVAMVQATAVKCFEVLGCRHLGRVDMIIDDDGEYVLEINTLPGFTSHSLLPMAGAKAGYPASELCREIVEAALESSRETS